MSTLLLSLGVLAVLGLMHLHHDLYATILLPCLLDAKSGLRSDKV